MPEPIQYFSLTSSAVGISSAWHLQDDQGGLMRMLMMGVALGAGCLIPRGLPEKDNCDPLDTSGAQEDTAGAGGDSGLIDSGETGDTGSVVDADGDGYPVGEDCADGVAAINPDAVEVDGDGWDNNCDGLMTDDLCLHLDMGDVQVEAWVYNRTNGTGSWVGGEPWASGAVGESSGFNLCNTYELVNGHVLQINGTYTGADGVARWLVGSGGEVHIGDVAAGAYWLKPDEDCVWTDNGIGGGDLWCTVAFMDFIP